MADNRQSSENEKNDSTVNDKTFGGATSARQAKDSSASNEAKGFVDQTIGQVKGKAVSVIDEQKSHLASSINGVADTIRQIGENIGGEDQSPVAALAGQYGDNLAEQVEKISSYIEDKDLKELVHDVETFAHRQPVLFVAGAFALGILAARIFKSSTSKKFGK